MQCLLNGDSAVHIDISIKRSFRNKVNELLPWSERLILAALGISDFRSQFLLFEMPESALLPCRIYSSGFALKRVRVNFD